MNRVLRLLRAAAGSDRDLLDRYARDRDDEAFEALVGRYGAGVWAACVRLAGRDAEDAFQAVFLTLSRKAGTVTGSLPAWLHAVTRRIAANLRRNARRRSEVESAARPPASATEDVSLREGLALLDEEMTRLPERYRAVLIVCCLDGRSRDEAAVQLGWSEGQVKGRLQRARDMLRARLARRGVELGGVLLVAAAARPTPGLAGPPSPTVSALAQGVIRDMAIQKFGQMAAALTAVVGVGVVLAGGVAPGRQPSAPKAAGAPSAPAAGAKGDAPHPLRAEYQAVFERAVGVVVGHFEQITYANRYDGRIEARQPVGKRQVTVEIRRQDDGRLAVSVRVLREAADGRPAGRDTDLEQVVLRQLGVPGDAPARTEPVTAAHPGWGEAKGGVRVGLSFSGAERLSVVVENVGKDDTVVDLGMMLANGKRQFPTAVALLVAGADGKSRRFERRAGPGVAGRVDPLVVPLAAGCSYTLPGRLSDYGVELAPGAYRVVAELTGERVTRPNVDMAGLALLPYWTGVVRSAELPVGVPEAGSDVKR